MAIKDAIVIDDSWIDLNDMALPADVSVAEIEKLLDVYPIKVSLEVILPKGSSAKGFDYSKNADIKKFRTSLESKVAQALAEIAGEDQPEEGKKALDDINSYLEKAQKSFRVVLRTAIAKVIGCKPDDLMTAGSIRFEKIEFKLGVGDSTEEKFPLLDLSKAFKRVKKDQHFGVAWKANEIVVSVRLRKAFKQAELKELRDCLPEDSSRGANMQYGEFYAFSKGKIELRLDEKKKAPHEILLRKAFREQSKQKVHIKIAPLVAEKEAPAEKNEKAKVEDGKAEKGKSK